MTFRNFLSATKTKLFREPKDELARLRRWGPRGYFLTGTWKKEMEAAAYQLEPIPVTSDAPPLEVWFLTGENFWYQSAFCAWTLARQTGRKISVSLVSDGTLKEPHEAAIRALFPDGTTVHKEAIREKVETLLPLKEFPVLRQRWADYVNIRKLTDVHLGSTGTKLVLDSDMLFFDRPTELLDWWDHSRSQELCLMTDCAEAYGYSRKLMEELSGSPIPELLNVGVCGITSEKIDWHLIEKWCAELLAAEGTSYFLEQGLVAMMASTSPHRVMPKETYITFPTQQNVLQSHGILQHYVSDSKPWYFGVAWKLASKD